ncbi:hypothetical protein XENOCAPTIV_006739, partial [Xenoophorus captivus]
VQRYRFGTITFGLVALVQLGLITFLALRIQASQKNLTEVKEQLIRTIYNTEANYTNVREKRDDLKRALNDFSFQLNSLTEERDKLKIINYGKCNKVFHFLHLKLVPDGFSSCSQPPDNC